MPNLDNRQFYNLPDHSGSAPGGPSWSSWLKSRKVIATIVGLILAIGLSFWASTLLENYQEQQQVEREQESYAQDEVDEAVRACEQEGKDVEQCEGRAWNDVAIHLGRADLCMNAVENWQATCVSMIALDSLDVADCGYLEKEDRDACRDSVYLAMAVDGQDLAMCEEIQDHERKETCLNGLVNTLARLGACPQEGYGVEACQERADVYALSYTGDVEACSALPNEDQMWTCLELAGSVDEDRDGLVAQDEFQAGTSVTNPDTDEDALSDFVEIRVWGTDPLQPDTDGDGYADGVEVESGNDPTSN